MIPLAEHRNTLEKNNSVLQHLTHCDLAVKQKNGGARPLREVIPIAKKWNFGSLG